MVRLKDVRRTSAVQLEKIGCESPLADVDFLLTHLLGFDKGEIIIGEKFLDSEQQIVFDKAFLRLLKGEPVQYVAGGCEFMSLWFKVSPDTLIPRADTEILVERVMDFCREKGYKRIFEIGTGSGCIPVSLAHYLPEARVLSVDISEGALAVAGENAQRMKVSDRCDFEICDVMKEFPVFEKLPQVVVSNPPYIPARDIEELAEKVKSFEPRAALDGGMDGLDFYRKIAGEVPIDKDGVLAFEVGIGQARMVCDLMRERFYDIETVRDLSGVERVVSGRRK